MRTLVFYMIENNFSILHGDFRENLALNYPASRAAKLIDYLSCVEYNLYQFCNNKPATNFTDCFKKNFKFIKSLLSHTSSSVVVRK